MMECKHIHWIPARYPYGDCAKQNVNFDKTMDLRVSSIYEVYCTDCDNFVNLLTGEIINDKGLVCIMEDNIVEDKKFIKSYLKFVNDVCEYHKWDKGWSRGGCYMHLEVSEFIEALRGKGDSEDELGDVLFTVLAVADYHKLDVIKALERNMEKHRRIIDNEKHKS